MSNKRIFFTFFITFSIISAQPTFTEHVISTSADGVNSVYPADVDGDGDMDVLSASFEDGQLPMAWYENDGTGNFTVHSISTTVNGAWVVHATDVDGDGDMDVLSGSVNDNTIAWYENNGSENFTQYVISTSADAVRSVYAADVDGDGDMDVLSACDYDNKIAWYENNGSESFTEHAISTQADYAMSVHAADVDGDGDMDVLSASKEIDEIAWFENDGSESFTEHEISNSADGAWSVYAADVDVDGDMDVISASFYDHKIAWYENNGSESFTEHVISTSAENANFVYVADVDGDGDMDVLSASSYDDKIAWYENDGSENFTENVISTSADGARSVHATDVDGDGDMDVLSASYGDDKIAWYEQDGSPVLTTYVPDDNFEQALIDLGYDDVLDDYVPTENISGVTVLNVSENGISDLAGIEGFTSLHTLYSSQNQLTAVDLTNNTALSVLYLDNAQFSGQLTSLDVSNNAALTYLNCTNNILTSLDVSNNTALTYLDVSNNRLTNLDVSNNILLTDLYCYENSVSGNQLTSLDVTNNTLLTSLDCGGNQLTSLNVSNNTALTYLGCWHNQITSLDVSSHTALLQLYCYGNQLTSLDLSNNTSLTRLECEGNQLTSLDLSNNMSLIQLYCSDNSLTTLDLSNNTLLNHLSCENNQLTGSLQNLIGPLTNLTRLRCHNNQLSGSIPVNICELDIDFSNSWHFNISNNNLCPPYPLCIAEYVGEQDCTTGAGDIIQMGSDIDGEAAEDFSGTVSISSDGTIVAIGAVGNDGNSSGTGHVRVYEYSGGDWVQLGSDIDGEAEGDFSGKPSMSSDGTIVAVGGWGNDGNGENAGHVRVFEYSGSDWVQLGSDIDGEAEGDGLGGSLSINSDGTIVAIGAKENDDNGEAAGHVRVYEYSGGDWVQLGSDIDGEAAGDNSGFSVSISSDGSIVSIGAPNNDGNGEAAGHVRVYEYSGGDWVQLGSDIDGEAEGDGIASLGKYESLSSDGTIVAFGASRNDGNGSGTGHVRVFEYSGGDWIQLGSDIDGEADGDVLGDAVSLNSNGTILAVGAVGGNDVSGIMTGYAQVYYYSDSGWVQIGSNINGEAEGDVFGSFVSLNSDGNIVAVGAVQNSGNGEYSGHVRVYSLGGTVPYTGPVWHVAGFGSDSLGDGSYGFPYGSIQKAIDVSTVGDTVRVSSGTYIGNINFYGKDIVVEGEGPETTIIDGNGSSSSNVVRFFGFETAAAQLRGFTITNGAAASGAGIYCNNANPTIEHVLITNNSGSSGAGLYCLGSSPTLKNVTITLNSASLNGGAIYTRGASSSPTLVDCILFTNSPNEIYLSDGNANVTYSDIQGGWDGVGNINAWPLFCDSDNGASYKLAENSACASSGQGGNYMGAFPVGCAAILSTEADILPSQYTLHQNYPNPFNPITQIRYDLPEDEHVSITIYNLMGHKIKSLVNTNQAAGYRSIHWNATNDLGQPVSAGMYIYTIQAGEFRQTRKMVLLK